MTVTYGLSEEVYSLKGESRISYGIVAYADADEGGTAVILTAIRDITDDRQRLSELVRKCNHGKLSLIHLADVVEDFLAE